MSLKKFGKSIETFDPVDSKLTHQFIVGISPVEVIFSHTEL